MSVVEDKGKGIIREQIETNGEGDWMSAPSGNRNPKPLGDGRHKYASFLTLIVKGYPHGWFLLNLEKIFGRVGAVMDVVMPRVKDTGVYRGFALVRMGSEAELARAVSMLHRVSYGGKKLLVQRARYGPESLTASYFQKQDSLNASEGTMQLLTVPTKASRPVSQSNDTMMKFASFETIVEMLYKHASPTPKDQCSIPFQVVVSYSGGFFAGVFCAVVSHPAEKLACFLNNAKGASVGDAVKKLGLWGLFIRGLPLRIVVIGTVTSAQWMIYDLFKTYFGLPTTGGVAPAAAAAPAQELAKV